MNDLTKSVAPVLFDSVSVNFDDRKITNPIKKANETIGQQILVVVTDRSQSYAAVLKKNIVDIVLAGLRINVNRPFLALPKRTYMWLVLHWFAAWAISFVRLGHRQVVIHIQAVWQLISGEKYLMYCQTIIYQIEYFYNAVIMMPWNVVLK